MNEQQLLLAVRWRSVCVKSNYKSIVKSNVKPNVKLNVKQCQFEYQADCLLRVKKIVKSIIKIFFMPNIKVGLSPLLSQNPKVAVYLTTSRGTKRACNSIFGKASNARAKITMGTGCKRFTKIKFSFLLAQPHGCNQLLFSSSSGQKMLCAYTFGQKIKLA